jgi:hypothetical protein
VAEKRKDELNEERIVEYLQDIVNKIRTEEDPFLLNTYRRLFRKAVPSPCVPISRHTCSS